MEVICFTLATNWQYFGFIAVILIGLVIFGKKFEIPKPEKKQ